MCTSAQTPTGKTGRIETAPGVWAHGVNVMMLLIGALIVSTGLVILSRVRTAVDAATLGWMGSEWLASHRASHP
jgi:hypothetical protein